MKTILVILGMYFTWSIIITVIHKRMSVKKINESKKFFTSVIPFVNIIEIIKNIRNLIL